MSKSICLYRYGEIARRNNAFSLGPILEKEKLVANGGNLQTGSVILGFSSKFLRRTMFSKKLSQPLLLRMHHNANKNIYVTKVNDHTAVQCLMLTCMDTLPFFHMPTQLNTLYP